jgi:mRNA interferase RelE/StbE
MMAVFGVEYSAESLSQLKGIDKTVVKRIIKKIESTQNNPHLFFKRLVGRPEYKLRVGDYRVISQIEEHSKIIFIRSIGHRKEIYEKL